MAGTGKRRSASFKARVALEAAKQTRTAAELAKAYQVHPVQISPWKEKQLFNGAKSLFRDGRRRATDDDRATEDELYERIGRLNMEVEWLKGSVAHLGWGQAGPRPARYPRPEHRLTMRSARPESIDLLSPADRRVGGESSAHTADRRQVHGDAVLRQPADRGDPGAARRGGQSQVGQAADGTDGPGGSPS
jgi:transposase